MKKWTIPAIVLGAVLLIAMIFVGTYNSLVGSRESVKTAFSNLETQYQRRADLIPNLVNTVKGSGDFEQQVLTDVVEARANATKITVDAGDPQSVQNFQNAQDQLSGSLSRLIATVEAYPNIQTTKAYQDLMVQLEGTENRIAVARGDFNEAARPYNTRIQTFPTSLVAGLFGFDSFPYFQATAGAENAPTVDFGNEQ